MELNVVRTRSYRRWAWLGGGVNGVNGGGRGYEVELLPQNAELYDMGVVMRRNYKMGTGMVTNNWLLQQWG